MSEQKYKKINQLEKDLPEGLLVDAAWMERNGYYGSLRSRYLNADWLEQPARGVYRRRRGSLSWEQVVISLQTLMQFPVSVGGRTALETQGYAHYLSHRQQTIHLYADQKLPGWLGKLPVEQKFKSHNRTRFLPPIPDYTDQLDLSPDRSDAVEKTLPGALRLTPWGTWKWPLVMSTPERAFLELLDELPKNETFDHADALMEGLSSLSPRRLQKLLEEASSIKVKRLFFFFADRHRHRWLSHLDKSAIDLGKGKRMLVKGGKLDPVYNITVPEALHGLQ
ncbi:type IV toxin-antitoxin system AbiEi family antitoxin domain-containing protein [Lentisalinibacter salinarum]|uniref:type IV toxin-antitoxin system AbiEi family antitoxin domain-containing protein n=1 Tax=Lentisalinibacter salinarum TaxID=2992239 RepID=UPI00386E08D2